MEADEVDSVIDGASPSRRRRAGRGRRAARRASRSGDPDDDDDADGNRRSSPPAASDEEEDDDQANLSLAAMEAALKPRVLETLERIAARLRHTWPRCRTPACRRR